MIRGSVGVGSSYHTASEPAGTDSIEVMRQVELLLPLIRDFITSSYLSTTAPGPLAK